MKRVLLVLLACLIAGPALAQQKNAPRSSVPGTILPCDLLNLIPGCKQPNGSIFNRSPSSESNPLATLNAEVLKKLLADFTYAHARAKAANNTVTEPCWAAWVTLLTAQQQPLCVASTTNATPTPAPADGSAAPATPSACPAGQTELTQPDAHLVTDAEYLSEFINQLQPNSPISLACAPALQAGQKSIGQLIGAVLSGGALGLFKLP